MAECPECGWEVKGTPGKIVKCPECDAKFRVPKEESRRAPAKAAAKPAKGAKKNDDKKPAEDGADMYGFSNEEDLGDIRKRNEEHERKIAEEKKAKEKPVIEVRRKNIGDLKVWAKVDTAMIWFLCGVIAWAVGHLLFGLILFLGMVKGPDYAGPVVAKLIAPDQPPIELGEGDALDRPSFVLAMLGSLDFFTLTKVLFLTAQVFAWIRIGLWVTGYFIAWPAAPRELGGRGQIIALWSLAAFNFLTGFFLIFLPFAGAYNYCPMPVCASELAMAEFNMDRSLPMHIFWSFAPFWETLLSVVLMTALYMEPIMIAYFIWTVAATIKEEPLEAAAAGALKFGFSVMFLHLAYQLFALSGTSPVLVRVLQVFYLLWYAAFIAFLVQMTSLVFKCRETFRFYFFPDQD